MKNFRWLANDEAVRLLGVPAVGLVKAFGVTFDRLNAVVDDFERVSGREGAKSEEEVQKRGELALAKCRLLARDLRKIQRKLRFGLLGLKRLDDTRIATMDEGGRPGYRYVFTRPWSQINNEFWCQLATWVDRPEFVDHPYPTDLGGYFDRRLRAHLGALGRKFHGIEGRPRRRRKGKRKKPDAA